MSPVLCVCTARLEVRIGPTRSLVPSPRYILRASLGPYLRVSWCSSDLFLPCQLDYRSTFAPTQPPSSPCALQPTCNLLCKFQSTLRPIHPPSRSSPSHQQQPALRPEHLRARSRASHAGRGLRVRDPTHELCAWTRVIGIMTPHLPPSTHPLRRDDDRGRRQEAISMSCV
jgi:hypothetical protein